MFYAHLFPVVVALVSSLGLASCRSGGPSGVTTPQQDNLFDTGGEVQALSGTNVILGEYNPIRRTTGQASSDGTEIGGLDFQQATYLGTIELPSGIRMDGYRIYDKFTGLNVRNQTVVEINDVEIWVAAPATNNQQISLEFSEIHKFVNNYHFYIDDTVCYSFYELIPCPNETAIYRGFGVSGFETEVLPSGTADYFGVWVGRMTHPGDFSDYAGDALLSVDFTNSIVSGQLFNPEPLSPVPSSGPDIVLGDITLDAQIVLGQISGDAQMDVQLDGDQLGFNGDIYGHFFGPTAEEAGGVVDLDGYSARYGAINFSAAFIGEQQISD